MIYQGDRTNYGESIGILMMDSSFPRIPGDIGNATTFPFPVRYKIVRGADIANVVESHSDIILNRMIEGARELERDGVKAITGSCGFLAIWQKEIAASVNIPVFMSSLLQVPFAYAVSGSKPVGIITAQAHNLTAKHMEAVHASNIPVIIRGMDPAPEFHKVFTDNGPVLDSDLVENEVAEIAKKMCADHAEIGSIVLECSNLPPYAARVARDTNLPVFDLTTMIKYIYSAVHRTAFCGHM